MSVSEQFQNIQDLESSLKVLNAFSGSLVAVNTVISNAFTSGIHSVTFSVNYLTSIIAQLGNNTLSRDIVLYKNAHLRDILSKTTFPEVSRIKVPTFEGFKGDLVSSVDKLEKLLEGLDLKNVKKEFRGIEVIIGEYVKYESFKKLEKRHISENKKITDWVENAKNFLADVVDPNVKSDNFTVQDLTPNLTILEDVGVKLIKLNEVLSEDLLTDVEKAVESLNGTVEAFVKSIDGQEITKSRLKEMEELIKISAELSTYIGLVTYVYMQLGAMYIQLIDNIENIVNDI